MNRFSRLLTTLAARLRGRPSETAAFRDLIADACEWTTNRQEALKRVFDIGSYERFDWYQEKGIIVFSTAAVPKVVANIQFVGSTSNLTHTWLWSWANPYFLEPLTTAAAHVRHVGEEHGFQKLVRAKWYADEIDGWEMTSVQAKLTGAEGVYRTPSANGATFMTLTDVRWASPDESYAPAADELLAPVAGDFDLEEALEAWRWLVPQHLRLHAVTAFGDLLLVDDAGAVLFLNTSAGTCEQAAISTEEYERNIDDPQLVDEWFMPSLLHELRKAGVKLSPGECYSPLHSPILGGTFTVDNWRPTSWRVHFYAAGQLHEQVKDLPSGTKITKIHFTRIEKT